MVAFPASPWLPSPPELQDLNQSLALGAAGAAAVTMVLTVVRTHDSWLAAAVHTLVWGNLVWTRLLHTCACV